MKKILLFASIVALFAACSSKSNFELEVNIVDNESIIDKKLIVVYKVDGRFISEDTTKIRKNNFSLKIPYEGQGLLDISIPESKIYSIMMAVEKGKAQLKIEGDKPYISGTPINDRLQAFNLGSDSVSLLFDALDKELDLIRVSGSYTSEINDEFRERRMKLLRENTDRLITFVKENVDNPVGEYFFMTNYIMFPEHRQTEMRSFATERLKKEFGFE